MITRKMFPILNTRSLCKDEHCEHCFQHFITNQLVWNLLVEYETCRSCSYDCLSVPILLPACDRLAEPGQLTGAMKYDCE